jgi:hypothetical protein
MGQRASHQQSQIVDGNVGVMIDGRKKLMLQKNMLPIKTTMRIKITVQTGMSRFYHTAPFTRDFTQSFCSSYDSTCKYLHYYKFVDKKSEC